MSTSIEWTDQTWNPIVGCSRVSKGCEHCYAERVAHRGMAEQHRGLTVMGKKGPRWTGEVRFLPERLAEPLRWRKPRRVFVNSMSDLFHEGVSNEQIAAVFGVMAGCPQHTFQVLTKRPERALEWFRWIGRDAPGRVRDFEVRGCALATAQILREATPAAVREVVARGAPWPLPHVWLGVSVEDQATADERIPDLIGCDAAVRFVSYEPALAAVDFRRFVNPRDTGGAYSRLAERTLDWIIIGGESGPGARPFDLAWARSTIAQCREAGVPVFVKQLGARPFFQSDIGLASYSDRPMKIGVHLRDRKGGDMDEWPEDLRVRQWPRREQTGGAA